MKHRLSWPEHERRQPWLSLLLDCLAAIDASVEEAVVADGRSLACGAGCFYCCLQPIPITPLEVLGIRFYIKEKLPAAQREKLLHNWETQTQAWAMGKENIGDCPMLLDGRCGVYPVRPIACRRYNVFGGPCKYNEDCTETRLGDMPHPSQQALFQAFIGTKPFYVACGLWKDADSDIKVFFSGLSTEIRRVDWSKAF